MTFDDQSRSSGIFTELIRDISHRTQEDPEAPRLRAELRREVYENLRSYFPNWKRYGGMTEMSVIYALPANPLIKEDGASYERLVYGTAKDILEQKGFTLETKESRWKYKK